VTYGPASYADATVQVFDDFSRLESRYINGKRDAFSISPASRR